MSDIGHNSNGVAGEHLKSFIERISRLEAEKNSLAVDIRDVYAEAKESGFDVKTMRQVVRLRKKDSLQREAEQELLDLYLSALGMLADLPLGQAAIEREFGATP